VRPSTAACPNRPKLADLLTLLATSRRQHAAVLRATMTSCPTPWNE